MTQKTKRIGLLLLSGALVSLVLLATGLSNLELHSGSLTPFSDNSGQVNPVFEAFTLLKANIFSFLQGLLALSFLILLGYVSARIILDANSKMTLRLALLMAVLLALVYILPRTTSRQSIISPGDVPGITKPPVESFTVTPLGGLPKAIIWLVITIFGLGLSLPIIKIFTGQQGSIEAQDLLLQEAETAVQALHSGIDLKNVILNYYLHMTRAIQEEKGIERKTMMTVREFEDWLKQQGFPAAPVHNLTTLFEKVRYGVQPTNIDDEKVAAESLMEIIQFCQAGKPQQ